MLVFTLGRLNYQKGNTVFSRFAQNLINSIAFARAGTTCDQRVGCKRILIQSYRCLLIFPHMEDVPNANCFILLSRVRQLCGINIAPKRSGFQYGYPWNGFHRQSHCNSKFIAINQGGRRHIIILIQLKNRMLHMAQALAYIFKAFGALHLGPSVDTRRLCRAILAADNRLICTGRSIDKVIIAGNKIGCRSEHAIALALANTFQMLVYTCQHLFHLFIVALYLVTLACPRAFRVNTSLGYTCAVRAAGPGGVPRCRRHAIRCTCGPGNAARNTN